MLTESGPATLVGSVGYKGPPADGVVEIGPSTGVLEKLGFERAEPGEADEIEFALRRS